MSETKQIEVGTLVSFTSKKTEMTGKVVKIYDENGKTYYKISSEKKYFFKQLGGIQCV